MKRFFLRSDRPTITFADVKHMNFVLPDHDEGSNDAELLDVAERNLRIWYGFGLIQ